MPSTIRRATEKDFDALAPLVSKSQIFQKRELEGKLLDEDDFKKEDRKLLAEWIRDPEKAYFLAEDEGETIGFVLCMINNPLSKDASISDLYVEPQCRGTGIGKKLADAALRWLKEHNVRHVTLAVHKCNTPALKIYKATGFSPQEDNYLLMGLEL